MGRKKIGVFLVGICLLFGMFFLSGPQSSLNLKSVSADSIYFDGGTGVVSDPYQIANATQLTNLSTLINDTATTETYKSAYYILTADIDLSGQNWVPIGSYNTLFAGYFDGNNHTISNLTIPAYIDTSNEYGLFGKVLGVNFSNKSTITNVELIDADIDILSPSQTSWFYVGAVAGYIHNASISNCLSINSNIITNYGYVGGLIGRTVDSIISKCCNIGNISVTNSSGNVYAGGITGLVCNSSYLSTISNCCNIGNISATTTCYIYAAGICGHSGYTTISNCYNTGDISASSSGASYIVYAAGISGGLGNSTISKSYNTGDISGTSSGYSSYACAGGISADITPPASINNCYNAGNVSSNSPYYYAYSAGIAGRAWSGSSGYCPISYCYNIGLISSTGTTIRTAGISGGRSIINYCYALTGMGYTSLDANSSSTITGSSITTTTAMKEQSTYGYWDFVGETTNGTNDIWTIFSSLNNGYPFLNINILEDSYILIYDFNDPGHSNSSTLCELDSIVTLESPTSTNRTFLGWSDGTILHSAGSTFTMPSGNVFLTAVWIFSGQQPDATDSSGTWSLSGPFKQEDDSYLNKIIVNYENVKVGSTIYARVLDSNGDVVFFDAISPVIISRTTIGELEFSITTATSYEFDDYAVEIYSSENYTLYNFGVFEVDSTGERNDLNSLETVYFDPAGTYGGTDLNSGAESYAPVATLEMAKSLLKRGGTLVIMSTLEITEDTTLDFSEIKEVTNIASCTYVISISNGAELIVNDFNYVSTGGYVLFDSQENATLILNDCEINTMNKIALLYLNSIFIINGGEYTSTNFVPISFYNNVTITLNEAYFHNFVCGISIFATYELATNQTPIVSYADITLNDCTFENNSGTLGAVANLNAGSLTVNGGTYSGNTATVGGVFYINALGGATCPVSITGATFSDNSTSGFYVLSSADYDIKHSGIGLDTDSINNLCGAGVIFCSQPLTIDDCTFSGNEANGTESYAGGGVILVGGASASLDITNSRFIDNYSAKYGGALFVSTNEIEIIYSNITNCTFTGNTSFMSGGAIMLDYAGVLTSHIIKNCSFNSNESSSTGGAISMYSGLLEIYNCKFNDNQAIQWGGAIRTIIDSTKAYNCVFSNNQSGTNGGAVWSGTYYNCTFYHNYAGNHGGAAYGATIYDSEIYQNKSNSVGGGTFGCNNHNCNIYQNFSDSGGGTCDGTNFNCKIYQNYAMTYGGTRTSSNYNTEIYQNYSTSYIVNICGTELNTTFTQNVSESNYSTLVTHDTASVVLSGTIEISGNRWGAEYDELTFIAGSETGTSVTIRIPRIVDGELVGGTSNDSIEVTRTMIIDSTLQGNLVLNVTGANILKGTDPIAVDLTSRSDSYYSNENSANDFINVFNSVFTFENGASYNIEYKPDFPSDDDIAIRNQNPNGSYKLGVFIKIALASDSLTAQKDKLDFVELNSGDYVEFNSRLFSNQYVSYFKIPNEVNLNKRYLILGCYDGVNENTANIEVVGGKLQLTFGTGGEGKVFTSTENVPANRIFRASSDYVVTDNVGNWTLAIQSIDNLSSILISMSGSLSGSNLIEATATTAHNLRIGCDYRADTSVFGTIQASVYNGNTDAARAYFSNTNTNVSSGKQFINYSAYDTCAVADGTTNYSIEVNAFTAGAVVTYSTDGITYSSTPITANTAGRTRVYFRIELANYFTICGMRNIILVNNAESSIKPTITSYGTPPVLTLSFDKTSFTADEDVTSLMSGYKMVDTNGQIVNGTFKAVGGAIAYTDATLVVRFYPTNFDKYSQDYYNVSVSVKYVADAIYYSKVSGVSNFYLDSNPTAASTILSISLEQAIDFLANNGKIYFSTPYIVSTAFSILSGKNITFVRNFVGEMFNITSTGTLQIGSKTMGGEIVLNGNNQLGEFALIMNAGTLKIYGNVVIQNAFNNNGTTGQGGAICSTGTADLDFKEIVNCRSLNASSLGYGGAIYNAGTMKVANLKISNCLSTQGGAIYNAGSLNMTNCNLDSNKGWFFSADIYGCSIFTGGANSSLKMTSCKISNSFAVTYDTTTPVGTTINVSGGGIYVGANGMVEIYSSTISDSQAKNGGGIYVSSSGTLFANSIVIQKCVSSSSGSAIYTGNADNVTLSDYAFVGNATSSGTINTGTEGLYSVTGSFTLMGDNLSFELDVENENASGNLNAKYEQVLAVLGILAVILVSAFFGIKSSKNRKKI